MIKRFVFIAALCVFVAASAQADFSSSTDLALSGPGTTRSSLEYRGQLNSSLARGQTEDSEALLFFERSSVISGSDLVLTLGGPVAVGTEVNSYILHFDPVGSSSTPVWEFHGTLTFDETILGVIFDTNTVHGKMASSDTTVGLGAGYYESDYNHRKFEEGQDKWNDIAILGNSVTFDLFTNSSMDEVRIITSTVPVPGAVLLGLLGLSAASVRLRKRS